MEEIWNKEQYREHFMERLTKLVTGIGRGLTPAGQLMNFFSELPKGQKGQNWVDNPPLTILPGVVKAAVHYIKDSILYYPALEQYCFEFHIEEAGGWQQGIIRLRFWRVQTFTTESLNEFVKAVGRGEYIQGGIYNIPITDPVLGSFCDQDELVSKLSSWILQESRENEPLREYDFEIDIRKSGDDEFLSIVFWRSGRKKGDVPLITSE